MKAVTVKVPTEAATTLAAVFDLLEAVKVAIPEMGALFAMGVRVALDTRERALLISVVDEQGHGHAVAAVCVDPSDQSTFGDVGVPEPTDAPYGARPASRLH